MPKVQGDSHSIGRALHEHFPSHVSNLENLDYMNIESLVRRLPKTVSAEQLRVVCVSQQQAVIRGLCGANLYSDMARLSPELDFSFVPIKHLEERIRDLESRLQPEPDAEMHEESSEEHLSIGKGEHMSAEDTGFDCELRNIMDEEQEYRNRGAWLHETALFDLL